MHKIGVEEIRRFIQAQPDIVGEVIIDRLRSAGEVGEVGASSGIVLFTVSYNAGKGRITREAVLRHAPGSETRLFYKYDLTRQCQVRRVVNTPNVGPINFRPQTSQRRACRSCGR